MSRMRLAQLTMAVVAAVVGLLFAAGTHAFAAAKSTPNVLVLFADDLGYGDLSATGHPTIRSPNLDRLMNEGTRFTQWYSAFHVCSPSRASLMTGRLPIRVGCAGADWTGGVFKNTAIGGLPLNETTIADVLKAKGYATAAIGKWHLGQRPQYLPTNRGFDSYLGIPFSVDMGESAWVRWPNFPLPLLQNTDVVEQPVDLNKLTDRYARFADEFIHNSTEADKPWFLYMAFNHVHVPDYANPTFCNSSIRGRFGDVVSEMDSLVGSIMDSVHRAGAGQDTITFFTSDNGPWLQKQVAGGSAGLFRDGKKTTWEGGVREPAFVHWPGRIAPNITSAVATTYDILPTVASVVGAKLPDDRIYDGRDLSPVLFGGGASPHDCIFIYKGTTGAGCPKAHPNCTGLWAVRCGAYKLHYVTSESLVNASNGTFHEPPLIYQIEVDPSEDWPLDPSSSEYKAAHKRITAAVEEHLKTLTPVPNEIGKGANDDLAICACPDSQEKYPQFPNCTCNPENFGVNACTSKIKGAEREAAARASQSHMLHHGPP